MNNLPIDDDKTIIKPKPRPAPIEDDDRTVLVRSDILAIEVFNGENKVLGHYSFNQSFTVGRALDNSIIIDQASVSRHHLEIQQQQGNWWLINLKSANGVYIKQQLIEDKQRLNCPVTISLGVSGIRLSIQKTTHSTVIHNPQPVIPPQFAVVEQAQKVSNTIHYQKHELSPEQIRSKLLADKEQDDAGDYTRMVRKLIQEDRNTRKKSYKTIIWSLTGLVVIAGGCAAYQYFALENTKKLALDMFYDIKTLEVSLSQADIKLEESADALDKTMKAIANEKLKVVQEQLKAEQQKLAAEKQRMVQERARLANMKAKYRQYVEEANSFKLRFPTAQAYEEELITKIARELGESELEVPPEFITEVQKYIQAWKSSQRLPNAINTLEQNSYLPVIVSALKKQGLPLYFLYLPLQESNYNAQAIGPETRYGIAKGSWQLLASTAQDYGITPGPLAAVREYDEQDGRFDFKQATQAGTKYLKRIYSTEAQASGLLVMASYNYGDNRVKGLVQKMPDNPRDKNFWKFIQQHQLPKETYDYVFYIVSAAVIGEDPQHFGFKFAPPLLNADKIPAG